MSLRDGIQVVRLGRISFEDGMTLQKSYHERCVVDAASSEFLLICEHEPVITAGSGVSAEDLIELRNRLPDRQIVKADRGGLFTAHNPGQIVIYPVIRIASRRIGVRDFVKILAKSVIDAAALIGIQAEYNEEFPGVWVGGAKICAIGIRIDRRVSRHGIALNFENDLVIFNDFTPCGIVGRSVTSVRQIATTTNINRDRFEADIVNRMVRSIESNSKTAA